MRGVERNARELAIFDAVHDYEDYLQHARERCAEGIRSSCEPMSRDRHRFVQTNIDADASEALAQLDRPFLALFGDHDLNVDVEESRTAYRQLVPATPQAPLRVRTYADATHSLLRVEHFDVQVPDLAFIVKLMAMGESAFAERVLDDIADFALDR